TDGDGDKVGNTDTDGDGDKVGNTDTDGDGDKVGNTDTDGDGLGGVSGLRVGVGSVRTTDRRVDDGLACGSAAADPGG
ncbi:hypothetical protein, partial [Propionicimonas sp.]